MHFSLFLEVSGWVGVARDRAPALPIEIIGVVDVRGGQRQIDWAIVSQNSRYSFLETLLVIIERVRDVSPPEFSNDYWDRKKTPNQDADRDYGD